MAPEDWQTRLSSATSVDNVLAIVKDYLASLRPAQISVLPMDCRSVLVRDANELADHALRLARHRLRLENMVVDEIASFFSNASQRATLLMARARSEAANAGRG